MFAECTSNCLSFLWCQLQRLIPLVFAELECKFSWWDNGLLSNFLHWFLVSVYVCSTCTSNCYNFFWSKVLKFILPCSCTSTWASWFCEFLQILRSTQIFDHFDQPLFLRAVLSAPFSLNKMLIFISSSYIFICVTTIFMTSITLDSSSRK